MGAVVARGRGALQVREEGLAAQHEDALLAAASREHGASGNRARWNLGDVNAADLPDAQATEN